MADNTFPNLMAILSGIYFEKDESETCNPHVVGGLDQCPIIWKDFENSGYATALSEDERWISTFNYCKPGFKQQPTTHYFRPFTMALEDNPEIIQEKSSSRFCIGYQTYTDYIYGQAIDFATAYKNQSFFGLFWTNTFSHDDVSGPSSMDDRVKNYLEQMNQRGVLNTSAVIFFSDHGMRNGYFRQYATVREYDKTL